MQNSASSVNPSVRSKKKDIAVGVGLAFFALELVRDVRVPLLGLVDLGFHELGHLVTFWLPQLVTAAAGSFFQVAVPFGLAIYFALFQRDEAASALCLGWAATSAQDVARYMADAPFQSLPLLGNGLHDWAFVFGELNVLDSSHLISVLVRIASWAMIAGAATLLALPYLRSGGLHVDK